MGVREVWSLRHGVAPLLDLGSWGGGLGVLGIAFLLGLGLLPRLRAWRPASALLLRVLAGLIAAPILLLLVGQIQGAIFAFPWRLLALAGWVAGGVLAWREWRRRKRPAGAEAETEAEAEEEGIDYEHAREYTRYEHEESRAARLLMLAGWGCVAFALLGRLFPAFSPPLGYDTLEYHQGIIPHIFQAGRVEPIPHVFYSAQPLATEMLYTLASLLEGTPWGYAPGVIHWALVVLVALLGARSLSLLKILPLWRPWLLLLLLEHPLMMHLQIERLSDWYGVLMLGGGLWAFLECGARSAERGVDDGGMRGCEPDSNPQPRNPQSTKRIAQLRNSVFFLGLFAGGALEAKWTHSGTVVVPLLALALGAGWDAGGGGEEGEATLARRVGWALGGAILCGTVTFLIWLPWGAWLWGVRHNPFAPFLAGLFPSPEWPAARLHFLLEAHYPLHPWQWAYWSNLLTRLALTLAGPPLILLALVGAGATALARGISNFKFQISNSKKASAYPQSEIPIQQSGLLPGPQRRATARPATPQYIFRLAGAMVISVMLWGNLQFAADRFLGPTILAAAVVLAVVMQEAFGGLCRRLPAERARMIQFSAALLLAAGALVYTGQTFAIYRITSLHALGTQTRDEYLHLIYGDEYRVIRAANALPAGSRILALNDARRYLYTGRIDLASVFDASPIRRAVSGSNDAETIRRRLIQQGYTHVLFNGYEQVRILRSQTPLSLVSDPEFLSILHDPRLHAPDNQAGDAELARRYGGITEFSVDPLTPEERQAYLDFLAGMQRRAIALVAGKLGAPAFWLAPLEGQMTNDK